jgi:predicted transcriptional regulator
MTTAQIALGVLRRHLYDRPPMVAYELNLTQIAEEIEKELRPSFSEVVIQQSECAMRCPTCKETRNIYRRSWRDETTVALKMLQDRDMTTPEFGSVVKTQGARKTLSELAESDLVEICGKRKGSRLYRITQKGRDFLDGKEPAPSSWWRPDAPKECEPGELRFVHEMRAEHPLNDPALHAEIAVAV